LAALAENPKAINQIYNVAVSERTTLTELFQMLKTGLLPAYPHLKDLAPVYLPFRAGDVRHSQADIRKAQSLLGYEPTHDIEQGLQESLGWYKANLPVQCAELHESLRPLMNGEGNAAFTPLQRTTSEVHPKSCRLADAEAG